MMNWKNAVYVADGRINMEVEHPEYGWIPFTADPNDSEHHGRELYQAAIEAGGIAPYVPPSQAEVRATLPDLTRKQFRLGMRALGITSAMISRAIDNIVDEDAREVATIEWEDSDRYSRLHPLITQLMTVFGKTDEEVDAAWTEALTYT